MRSRLDDALEWAARGFRVFPLHENSKQPIREGWTETATSDPDEIKRQWSDPILGNISNYNVGVLTTGMVVLDVDVKNNKPGLETYREVEGHFDTLVVQTPSGGYHCYFNGPDSGQSDIGPGLDVRSHNGYVLAPGSTADGGYYTLVNDAPMAELPDLAWIRLSEPRSAVAATGERSVDLDQPTAVQSARTWLAHSAPIAIEGERGDETTFHVACMLVKDYALSAETALDMLLEWNQRCVPPWEPGELQRKLENAVQYGIGREGSKSPELLWQAVPSIPPPPPPPPTITETAFGNALVPGTIPPRPWVVDRMLMQGEVTLLVGAGSAGKSTFTLALAAHLSLGLEFAGCKPVRKAKSIVYNAEEDIYEQSRRLLALCMSYRFDYEEVKKDILLIGKGDTRLCLAKGDKDLVVNEQQVTELVELASRPDVGMLALDPLVSLHRVEESNNVLMSSVMDLVNDIATAADTAVLIAHHVRKPSGVSQTAGNADNARGAGSIVTRTRVSYTLTGATDKDREEYGIKDVDKYRFVRLDDAKMNISLQGSAAAWFRKEGITITNGDEVGVLKGHSMLAGKESQRQEIGDLLASTMLQRHTATLSITAASEVLQSSDALYKRMEPVRVRSMVQHILSEPVSTMFGDVHCIRHTSPNGKDSVLITLQ